MYGLERLTYLCLKGDTHTDFYTAFATEELRATPPTVLCSVSLSITVYTKTRNPAALVFIPICAGRRAGMRISMKNFIFISPNFPTNYWKFCAELKKNGNLTKF